MIRRAMILWSLSMVIGLSAEMVAPAGYVVRDLGRDGGQILVPEGWVYTFGETPAGPLYVVARENNPDGSYDTGLRIQVMSHVRVSSGRWPGDVVAQNASNQKAKERVLHESGVVNAGLFKRMSLETVGYPRPDRPAQEYHMIHEFTWSDDLDTVIGVTFGAPVAQWREASAVYAVISHFKLRDPDRVAAVRAARQDAGGPRVTLPNLPGAAQVPKSPEPIRAPASASRARVANIGTVQFVNKVADVPWRVGTDLEPFGRYIKAVGDAVAAYVDSQHVQEPAIARVVVGIQPEGGRHRAWLVGWDNVLSSDQQHVLEQVVESLPAPTVRNGPLAFSLVVELNGAKFNLAQPPALELPEDWKRALGGNLGSAVLPDALPDSVWSTPGR